MGLDPALGPDEMYAQFEERARRRRADRQPGRRGRQKKRVRPRLPGASILASRAGRVLALAAGALAVVTVVGLVALWPGGETGPKGQTQAFGGPTQGARVVSSALVRCPGPTPQQ